MIKRFLTIFGAIALVVLFAGQVRPHPPRAALPRTPSLGTSPAKEITVRGKLQKTVESGGWLIVANNQKYLILNAQRFQTEKWFTESTEVEAIGETKSDVVTTYMEGTPFEVRTMRPSGEQVRRKRKRKRIKVADSGNGRGRFDRTSAAGHRDDHGFSGDTE